MAQYTESLILAWKIAGAEAFAGKAGEIQPVHMLIGLCKLCDVNVGDEGREEDMQRATEIDIHFLRMTFQKVGIDPGLFRRHLRSVAHAPLSDSRAMGAEPLHRSKATREIFRRGEMHAKQNGAIYCGTTHLLHALMELPAAPWMPFLTKLGIIDPIGQMFGDDFRRTPGLPPESRGPKPPPPGKSGGQPPRPSAPAKRPPSSVRPPVPVPHPAPPPKKSPTPAKVHEAPEILVEPVPVDAFGSKTPTLDTFGRDLTQLAWEGRLDPVVGREKEIRMLARALLQKRKGNVILVGEPGVGKTCLVEGLAQWVVSPKAPPVVKGWRLVEVSMAALVAGTKYRGDFEERMQDIIDEVCRASHTILFIDEIHTIQEAGGPGAGSAANILKPALARSAFRCIGATTISEYRKFIEQDPALERRFQMMVIDEPTRDEALAILKRLRTRFEEHHRIAITEEALETAVDLSIRYLTDHRLPDKAIDLVDQACARAQIKSIADWESLDRQSPTAEQVDADDIATVVARRCRIPVERLTVDEAERLLQLEDTLRQRVIGQDEAIQAVSNAVRAARAGLKHPNRPVGVFLFGGATGTGKTELAKSLAHVLFENVTRLIRIDMSEYMEKHTISRLLGAPPGYVGHEEEGQLTAPVRTHPYSVVLFDEIEKAHPDILDILLQILDEGRLTDTRGRRVSFTETIIIMTTNLGSTIDLGTQRMGFGAANQPASFDHRAYRDRVEAAITSNLRPELLNRIQHRIVFYPLDKKSLHRVIDKFLNGVQQRLYERRITLQIQPAVYDFLVREGYDLRYGARELQRAVERFLVQPLGNAIIQRHFRDGMTVAVDVKDDKLAFSQVG